MILAEEDAKKFYDLWISLLDFVNQKYKLVKELYGMTSPEGLPLESVRIMADKLRSNKDVIDEFILSGFKMMEDEEKEIVSSWKRAIYGEFIVDRHLNKGSVFISTENNEVYIVKGIYTTWREMLINYPMPQILRVMLLPFKDTIIYDGLVVPNGVGVNKKTSEQSKQIYLAAKANGNLHYSL